MKRLDLSSKKLDTHLITQFFKSSNKRDASLGPRYHVFETYANWESIFVDSLATLKPQYHNLVCYNFITNLCSTIEVYLRELIVHNEANWNKLNYNELLADKITLENAYKLFKEANVTRETIIARHNSFNSVANILHVLSKLTCDSFEQEVENFEIFSTHPTTMKELHPDWKGMLNTLITERNKIVHEGIHTITLDPKFVRTLGVVVFIFMYSVDHYCTKNKFSK